jgi:membrane protein
LVTRIFTIDDEVDDPEHTLATGLIQFKGASPIEILKRTWTEIRADDVFGRAAQLAYYFFLALFPFLICVIATLSVFGSADRGRVLLFSLLSRFLPEPAFQLIAETFNQILVKNGPLRMSLGLIAAIWSASLGMGAVMDTLNAAYRIRETRSIARQSLTAIGLTVGMGIVVVLSILTVVVGDHLAATLALPKMISIAWHLVVWPLAIALLLLGFSVTYYFAPDLRGRAWQWITPGAMAGALLLFLVSAGLRIYVYFYNSYSVMYGSLGGVIVLLLCFYLASVALLSGGALNGVVERCASQGRTHGNRSARPKQKPR